MMPAPDLPLGKPVLAEAIDYHPLVVTSNVSLTETLSLMNQVQKSSCYLPNWENSLSEEFALPVQSSCVLVMEGKTIRGIFTERDLVRLIASSQKLDKLTIGQVMTHPVITLTEENFKDIFAVLFLFRRYRIRHLPIVGEQGELVGVVSHESLRSCLRPSNLLKLRRVSDVMSPNVIQASLTYPVLNLAQLMAKYQVSCVVIMQEVYEEGCLPVGIVTERDILQFQTLEMDLSRVTAEEVMSTPLFLLNPEDSLWFTHQQMQKMRLRRLVVSWDWGQGLGIVTQTSLLRIFDPMEMYGVVETLQKTVEELKREKNDDSVKGKVIEKKQIAQSQMDILAHKSNSLSSESQFDLLLDNLQDKLNSIINEPQMLPEKRQHLLDLGITDIEKLRNLLR